MNRKGSHVAMQNIVALYRLSKESKTKDGKRVQRGLSIDAQQAAVKAFAQERGLNITKEFFELISGRKKQRPVLEKALTYCRKNKAMLVIARLDRLARRVALISALLESKVHFRVVQFPDVDPKENPFFFQILAAVSELEVKFIRERTKVALAAKKAKGEELGKYGKNILSKSNRQAAIQFANNMRPLITELQAMGIKTVRQVTHELNKRRIPTFRNQGQKWHIATVHRLIGHIRE